MTDRFAEIKARCDSGKTAFSGCALSYIELYRQDTLLLLKALELACLSSTTLIYDPMGAETKRVGVDPEYWLEEAEKELTK